MKLHKAFCIGNCLKIMITFGFRHTSLEVGCYFIPGYTSLPTNYFIICCLHCIITAELQLSVGNAHESALPQGNNTSRFVLQVAQVSHLDDEILALHSEIVELQRSPYARRQGDKMEQLWVSRCFFLNLWVPRVLVGPNKYMQFN